MTFMDRVFGERIGRTRITPIVLKILVVFTVFLLVSNFSTNYVNLLLNREEQLRLTRDLLIKDLKSLYSFSLTQYDIAALSDAKDPTTAYGNIVKFAEKDMDPAHMKSLALGIAPTGEILFASSRTPIKAKTLTDASALAAFDASRAGESKGEGRFYFNLAGSDYFGIFKWSDKWKAFIVRAEELGEFYAQTQYILWEVTIIILAITLLCVGTGAFLLSHILRFVKEITRSLMRMHEDQKLGLIDLSRGANDEITYMGMSFNALSTSIENLMLIFRKFVTKDIAQRAYKEKLISLDGHLRDLTILFTDIKGFTYMTETLGNNIIPIINMHYDEAIRQINAQNGIVGSIIGDALLAVFGTLETDTNKSLAAVRSAYLIHDVAMRMRTRFTEKKEEIVRTRGALTEAEERVFQAILLELGVGIDGGEVYYGNIGSVPRMTNTVIGDNVNSASRLEGLTRVYKVPVIVSQFVRDEVRRATDEYRFLELDMVQVKGKTEGKRIYWPIEAARIDEGMEADIGAFEAGLAAYYAGDWKAAAKAFAGCSLPLAHVFAERIKGRNAPEGWSGIWTMTTK